MFFLIQKWANTNPIESSLSATKKVLDIIKALAEEEIFVSPADRNAFRQSSGNKSCLDN